MDRGGDNKMKAYVFSIGEKTTDLCCELMTNYGFDVVLYKDDTTLWEKLLRFYTEAVEDNAPMAVRIDADIIPNSNVKDYPYVTEGYPLWECSSGYDWYKQDRSSISIHYMSLDAIKLCLKYIDEAKDEIRPETYLWRKHTINPYTKINWTMNRGLHGYGQEDHRQRIKDLKDSRNQEYDWDLVKRIEAL